MSTGKTAEELHYELVSRPCHGCKAPGKTRIRVMAQLEEVMKRDPKGVAAIAATRGSVPTIPTRYGPMVCISEVWACKRCQRDAERAAARHPSWCIVEINRGPGALRPQIQVPA